MTMMTDMGFNWSTSPCFSTLEPSYLIRAIYPLLSSYSSPNKLAYPRHSLSRAALVTSGSPIFLLDAYSTLVVYYSPMAPKDLTFPPPHNSEGGVGEEVVHIRECRVVGLCVCS